ncbi:unnamed protein product [Prorocentrum cordatum]|uniref:Very-long-chain 3-oxoacyl-CoA synthase n=1 Tax=Prorocentrum cordatum TaxID=2364126 RepID=A0ABN9VHE8_9DINO|nr:unnamed protein product [Polarella glacialis]|mmetsp:Transcript_67159/g.174879  ORF Transcript_67159/g.174879 Transcript_67159/m.174879 type:complete len:123 (-) Transcript_67159:117-485(-)
MVQFCYHKVAPRPKAGGHWQKWGPVWLVLLATVLTMAQPLAVLFIYVGEVGYPEHKMWTSGWFPNTPLGITLYLFKWLGMVLLIVGVFQVTQLHVKIRKRWRQIRGERDAVAPAAAEEECTS